MQNMKEKVIIIAISIFLYNIVEITLGNVEQNIFSLAIILPFIFTSFALFIFNKYPSKCFIGDTYCYFAGMTFACAGILGHFSKTLLLFFIPQILNFLISLPQVKKQFLKIALRFYWMSSTQITSLRC